MVDPVAMQAQLAVAESWQTFSTVKVTGEDHPELGRVGSMRSRPYIEEDADGNPLAVRMLVQLDGTGTPDLFDVADLAAL